MPAYKDEKRGTWYVKFRYTDWQGNSKLTTKRGFKTKRAALNYEHDFKNRSTSCSDMTVSSLVNLYLENQKATIKPSSYVSMTTTINHHILPTLGKLKIADLTPARMLAWKNHLLTTEKSNGEKLSTTTVSMIVSQLSSVFTFGMKYYNLEKNPLRNIHVSKSTNTMSFWEETEFIHFMDYIGKTDLRCAFLILFYGGLRIGELRALEVSDIDFTTNKISITKSYSPHTKSVLTTKTADSNRVIAMPANIMALLQRYITSFETPPSPLFTAVSNWRISGAIKKYAPEAGIKTIRIHDLRHSHASYLINKGVPIPAISKRLGHKSPKMTLDVYAHIYNATDESIASMINDGIVSQMLVTATKECP